MPDFALAAASPAPHLLVLALRPGRTAAALLVAAPPRTPSSARRQPRRSTTPPRSSRPPAPASPSSSLKTWSAPTAPAPTRSSKRPPPSTTSPGSATTSRCPMHSWSFQAAVNARFFDTKSKKLGDDYRDYVFANQISIETPDQLRAIHREVRRQPTASPCPSPSIPWASSPQQVKADYALGQRIGIEHTPTIWIVTNATHARALRRGRRPQQALPAHRRGHRRTRGH